eukprot:gene16054-20513_t
MYQFIQQQITLCEQEIEIVLQQLVARSNDGVIENLPVEVAAS